MNFNFSEKKNNTHFKQQQQHEHFLLYTHMKSRYNWKLIFLTQIHHQHFLFLKNINGKND